MSTDTFVPNRTSLCVMQLVHGYFSKTRKPWTLMSQRWILEKLEQWHGIKIGRSTLNYNLAILRKEGLIDTVTRHKRCPKTNQFVCQVTLYKASRKLKKFFGKLAGYFRRCDWVPDVKELRAGVVPVVGKATSPERARAAYLEELRLQKKSVRELEPVGDRAPTAVCGPEEVGAARRFFAEMQSLLSGGRGNPGTRGELGHRG